MPKTVVVIDSLYYISFKRCFENLLPKGDPQDAFYFPGYNRVEINLTLENLTHREDENGWQLAYTLLPGPFDMDARASFIDQYHEVYKAFDQKEKFKLTESL